MGANRGMHASLRPRVLVVEDEPLVSRGILLLTNQVAQAHLAPTAAAASTALSGTESWGAFVIDVGLPDGSGIDVLARARVVHPRTPALILTGVLSSQVANAAFDLGAACVAKPVKSNCSLRLQQSEERPTPSSRAFRCICSVIHPRPRNPEHDFVYRVFRRNLPAI